MSMTPEQYRRSQELFLRAVEIDPANRSAWLSEQCAGDEQLQRNVQVFLDNDDPRTLLTLHVDHHQKTTKTLHRPKVRRWLESIPPKGLMALGALAVLLPVLLCGAIVERNLSQFRNRWRAASLVELVNAKENAVTAWLSREQMVAQSWANSTSVRELISDLAEVSTKSTPGDRALSLRDAPQQSLLNEELIALAGPAVRYAVWDANLITIADWSADRRGLGNGVTPSGAARLTSVFEGRATAVILGPDDVITRDYTDVPEKPRLGMLVPVGDPSAKKSSSNPIAVMLVYETGGEEELARFIRMSDLTASNETEGGTFVFNRYGVLLFDSPYDAQLRDLGLIPNNINSSSAKQLALRDPGVDLTRGLKPTDAFATRPLTKMVRMAVGSGAGVDVEGYRDVRGVIVAGAWKWLDDYDFGIGIEIEKNLLEPAMWLARLQSWAIFSLLGTSIGVIGYSMFAIKRLRSQMDANKRIGPYVLEAMIGEGGMGRVFKARHELLKRPTAIKLLRPELIDNATTSRFKREAELAARLEHPNTVSVFDFGISDEGLLYLVMEWIDGVTLAELVSREGKLTSERAVVLLQQIALSLREAHHLGLIHRDLKPQNVMVAQRACEFDVVKVLDFGLARDITSTVVTTRTSIDLIAGTPRYMAPERWQPMQPMTPAVDLFAFGCIAYYMLTAEHSIAGETIDEICSNTLSTPAQRPSAVIGDSVPKWLDDLTVQCMAKAPGDRPASFDDVLKILSEHEPRTDASPLSPTA